MENRIKEQQLGLYADRTSCSTMPANQFRLLLSSAAYALIQHFRQTAPAGTEPAQALVGRIRHKTIKLAARVQVSARRAVLHLSTSHSLQTLFRRLVERLTRPGVPPGAAQAGGAAAPIDFDSS
jgi:hypothetical protein